MSTKLEELTGLLKLTNRSGTHRCSICNSVNNEDIETNLGDFNDHTYYVNDPKDPSHFICGECDEVIKDLMCDYEMDNEDE